MPLYQLADHVDGLQELKAFVGYGVPKQYPLALNGMGDLGCGDQPCEACSRKNVSGFGDMPFALSLPLVAFTPPVYQKAAEISPKGVGPITSTAPSAGGGSNIDAFVGGAQKIAAAFAPFFQKAPKQITVVEKKQDYTTYAVIGGAVIVASVLAIAVGKSRRRK